MDTLEKFINNINNLSYKGKRSEMITPLSEIVFFVGAGFSKSWDQKYPTGNELFEFDYDTFNDRVADYLELLNVKNEHVTINLIKEINYYLEMQEQYPVMRSRFIDKQTIGIAQKEIRAHIVKMFMEKYGLNYTDGFKPNILWPNKLSREQKIILSFFEKLGSQATGDRTYPEGLRYHFISTNYDFVIETIISHITSSITSDDSFMNSLYRGITSKTFSGKDNLFKVVEHFNMQALYKINGGFEIYKEDGQYIIDYRMKSNNEIVDSPPIFMLPNIQQNYKDDYFIEVFSKSVRALIDAKMLVIVGSSFTDEDIMLRYLIRHFAEDEADFIRKRVFYIDIGDKGLLEKRLENIFYKCPEGLKSKSLNCFSGSFVEFAEKTTTYIK